MPDRHIVIRYQRQRRLRSACDRGKIGQCAVGIIVGVDERVDHHGAGIGHQQGLAVGGCLTDDVRADGSASTRL